MLADVIDILICPHCGGDLRQNGASLICSNGHTANVARQGYVSLLGGHSGTHTADSAAMLEARDRVLTGGLFQPVADAILEVIGKAGLDDVEGAVVDLGTGTGWYLAQILEALPERVGLGVDNSKFAARRAAKVHPRAGAVVADIWDEIPVRSGAAALVLDVFSPRNGEEIDRIRAEGGRLIVVTPTSDHLKELIEPFEMISVDPDKDERLEKTFGDTGNSGEARLVEWKMNLSPGEVRDLIGMGPSAGRIDPERLETLIEGLPDHSEVSGSVQVWTR
ncbi:MAG: putative RNA methyltransferase [Solirubrobacterales bacterium]